MPLLKRRFTGYFGLLAVSGIGFRLLFRLIMTRCYKKNLYLQSLSIRGFATIFLRRVNRFFISGGSFMQRFPAITHLKYRQLLVRRGVERQPNE